ncbi:hypothetical protein L7F22_013847 [Adiantum nelumboides]|nr:hypothetical protein [Adiantum nelumboides]
MQFLEVKGCQNKASIDDERRLSGKGSEYDIQTEGLVLTKRPLQTLKFFTLAIMQYLSCHKFILGLGSLVLCGWIALLATEGPHEHALKEASAYLQYALWWVALGVASSIGMGCGWHTFVLYLAPHVAMFTIKATLCGRVDLKVAQHDTAFFRHKSTWEYKDCAAFGEPSFPKALSSNHFMVPLLPILHEVHWEAVLWGIGTALGELPPYFLSRAGRIAGDRLIEFDDARLRNASDHPAKRLVNRLKLWAIKWFQQTRFKFWIILGLASVSNPFFDLAGVICGQCLVPLWMFLIPTLIGKALVKTHYQTMLVILLSKNQLVELLGSSSTEDTPAVSGFGNRLRIQVEKSLRNYVFGRPATDKEWSWKWLISGMWDALLVAMMILLICNFINATAQNHVSQKQRDKHGRCAVAEEEEDASAVKKRC